MKNILLSTTMLLLFSCSTDDAPSQESLLPPITTTGENTFGCLVDGKYFRPRNGQVSISGASPGFIVRTTESTNVEYDINDYKSDKTSYLLIHIENFERNVSRTYQIDESNGLRGLDGNDNNFAHGRFWSKKHGRYHNYYSFEDSGQLHSFNESIPNIINIHAGSFDLNLVNISDSSDTLKITLGRFDVNTFSLSNKDWD